MHAELIVRTANGYRTVDVDKGRLKSDTSAVITIVRPDGPTVSFEPTPGDAQGIQIHGQAQGAEVIGSALLYPNQAPSQLLTQVENCVAQGVSG